MVPTFSAATLARVSIARVTWPIRWTAPTWNIAGAPTITLRHIVGGAGIDRLPTFTQNVGLRVAIGFLRVDFLIDPADTHRHDAGVGFGFR